MIELYSPRNEIELALLKGILDSAGITYFVRNDRFGSMEIGPVIPLLNAKCILVHAEDFGRAKSLLKELLHRSAVNGRKPTYSTRDKLRMIVEALLFGWVVPGRSRRKKKGLVVVRPNGRDNGSP